MDVHCRELSWTVSMEPVSLDVATLQKVSPSHLLFDFHPFSSISAEKAPEPVKLYHFFLQTLYPRW